MRRASILACAVAAAAPLLVAAAAPGESVLDYFWPPEEGKTYVYEFGRDTRRLVRIVDVAREAGGVVRVETESRVEGAGPRVPRGGVGRALRETFRFAPAEQAIYRRAAAAARPESLLLKGPVRAGTRWEAAAGPSAPAGPPAPGTAAVCTIERVGPRAVLGKEATCADVLCLVPATGAERGTRAVFCRGIGYAGAEAALRVGGETHAETTERLVEVR